MITILHGDNILASRKALESFKLNTLGKDNPPKGKTKLELRGEDYPLKYALGEEILTLEGKKIDLTILKQALEAKSLFAENKLVVIENLLAPATRHSASPAGRQAPDTIIDYLTKGKFYADLILWEEKTLPTGILSKLKKSKNIKIQLFKQPAVIFKFLDSLKPGNTKEMLISLKRSIEVSEPEFVFYMLIRQFRLLLAITTGGKIAEVKRLAAWQVGKFKRQASYFSEKNLLKIYKELLIIDYQTKTGKSALDLTKRIELFIMSL